MDVGTGSESAAQLRTVIVHYHIFKNAGTSLDAVLRENFGARWLESEFKPEHGENNHRAVAEWLVEHPEVIALSSHTALMPVPQIAGTFVMPLLFIRHPIDRLRSAYAFERKQLADSTGSRMAKEHDFSGYLRARLAIAGDGFCRNFQTFRIAQAVPLPSASMLQRARLAVRQLPFIGLVEDFEGSMKQLEKIAARHFPEFKSFATRQNATSAADLPLSQKLLGIRSEIGDRLYEILEHVNQDDLEIFRLVAARYHFKIE